MMRNYWVGVASREHVLAAVHGGFCQLNHGKKLSVRRLKPGDRLVYYSPRQGMGDGAFVRAFTAIGEILEGDAYRAHHSECFNPYRRNVRYFHAKAAAIEPLLASLRFARGGESWPDHAARFVQDRQDRLSVDSQCDGR